MASKEEQQSKANLAFKCPCHGGEFDEFGRNIGGPPPRPFDIYRPVVEGDKVYFDYYSLKRERHSNVVENRFKEGKTDEVDRMGHCLIHGGHWLILFNDVCNLHAESKLVSSLFRHFTANLLVDRNSRCHCHCDLFYFEKA